MAFISHLNNVSPRRTHTEVEKVELENWCALLCIEKGMWVWFLIKSTFGISIIIRHHLEGVKYARNSSFTAPFSTLSGISPCLQQQTKHHNNNYLYGGGLGVCDWLVCAFPSHPNPLARARNNIITRGESGRRAYWCVLLHYWRFSVKCQSFGRERVGHQAP